VKDPTGPTLDECAAMYRRPETATEHLERLRFEELRASAIAIARRDLAAYYTHLLGIIETLPEADRTRCLMLAGGLHGAALKEGRRGLLALELAATAAAYNRNERLPL
jgi:hypothetical protein